ncbi:MAG TPA: hypothetical protein VNA25_08450 [Phycisphaerae bacterium]|nr:hypothetical protein [Phycisphaerae bacterium]
MKNTQNITLILLSITAAVLVAMLFGALNDREAYAGDAAASKGDYVMVPMMWSKNLDLLVVSDVSTRKIIVYAYNQNTKSMDIADTVDMSRVFAN